MLAGCVYNLLIAKEKKDRNLRGFTGFLNRFLILAFSRCHIKKAGCFSLLAQGMLINHHMLLTLWWRDTVLGPLLCSEDYV